MVKGKGHDKAIAVKGKGTVVSYKEQAEGWAAYYLDSCKVPLEKRQKQFQEKYSQFKEGNAGIVECRDWLYFAKFAFLVGLDSLCLPKCPSRSDLHDGSFPVEDCFECAMQAAHRGAKDGSIQSAVLFSHFADEFGLRGGILFIQHLTKGVSIDAWRDPKSDWLKGDPHRMPFELATDPTVVGVTKEERVEIKLREVKGLLVAMMQCGRLKVPEEQKQYQAVDGDLSKVLLDARHVLFSLATKASRLTPAAVHDQLVRTRNKVLLEKAADITLDFWRSARPAGDADTTDDKFNAAKLRAVMHKEGTKKGKAVKQMPAMKDMKDKLLTNQKEAARRFLMDVVPEAYKSGASAAPNPEDLAFARDLVDGKAKLQKDDVRKALSEAKPSEEERKTMELWLESTAPNSSPLECLHWEDGVLLSRPQMLALLHETALARLKKQYLEPRDGEAGSSAQQEQDSIVRGSGAAKNSLLSELEQLVHGKPYEGMQVPNLPADLDIEEFLSVGVDSPDSLAFLLPQAVHDVIAELANKSLRDQALDLLSALGDDPGADSILQTHREALGDACNTVDGLVEIEAVGEKDANLRYYNLDEPLKEAQWVAGVVSQAFGRKLCVRAGDEKALAIRGQLLLEIHYMQMRRQVAQARGEFEYDRALAKRAFLVHKRLETESDEDLRRNLAGDSPPLPLHCVSRVTRMYRDDDWLEEEAESAACADDRRWAEQKADIEPPGTPGRPDIARLASAPSAAADTDSLQSSTVNSFMADAYKQRGGNARPSDALRAVEQQLAHLYAEEVREKGRNSFLARTLEDVRDTLAAIEKSGDGSDAARNSLESIRVAGKLIENLEAQTLEHNRKLVAAAAAAPAVDCDQLDDLAAAASMCAPRQASTAATNTSSCGPSRPPADASSSASAPSQQRAFSAEVRVNGGGGGAAAASGSANLDDIDYETDADAYLTSTDDESVASLISEDDDATWKQRYLNIARDAADLLIESGFMSNAMLRAIAIYIVACLKIQGEHTTLFHVTWRHMALLSQDQLYELANKLCVRLGNLQKVLPCYRSALHDHTVMEACVSREGDEVLLQTASEQEDTLNDNDKFDAFRTVHDMFIPKQPRAQKPPKTIKAAEGFVNNFVDDLYREETPSNEEGPNSKRVKELIARAERLLHKAISTIEERHECLGCLEQAVHVYKDIVTVESQMRQQRQALKDLSTFGKYLEAWQQTHEGVRATLLRANIERERELLRSCEAGSKRARVNALPADIDMSCKAWAERLVMLSDDLSLTSVDKAKVKEEYGLWEQKTGINAKEGGVGILGIRTRQLMHERRLELLEALRDKPSTEFFRDRIKAIAGAACIDINKEVEEAFLGLLVQCQDIVKQDIRDIMGWLQRLDVRMEACRTEYHRTLQAAVEMSHVNATDLIEKLAWETLRQTVATRARNHAEAKKRALERQEQLRKEQAAREAQERLLREEQEREAARQEKLRRKQERQQELAKQQAAKQQQQAEEQQKRRDEELAQQKAAEDRAREEERANQEKLQLDRQRQQQSQREKQELLERRKQHEQVKQQAVSKSKKQKSQQQLEFAVVTHEESAASLEETRGDGDEEQVAAPDREPDEDDEHAILQRLLAMTAKSAGAEQESAAETKPAVASKAASMSSSSSQTGIEQSPRKRGGKVVEAAAPQGWGDEESESSVPDVRSWFTKSTGREADRVSNADRIQNSSLPKDPGKKAAPKERGPKCQCCKQAHKLVSCPKLTHLKLETRKKLTRMYEEGHTVDADNFLRKLGCLHCGALAHFLVACPELQFTTKDQRWELSDLYQSGNPKQAQKLVREWREAALEAGAGAKAAGGTAAAAAKLPPPQVKPADGKAPARAPAVPAAAARAPSAAAAAAQRQQPAAQIGAQQPPQPQPQPQQKQPLEEMRSMQSESSGLVKSRSSSFLEQLLPDVSRQDSTASSPQPGLSFGALFPVPDHGAQSAAPQQPPDLLYSLFPRPAAREVSPRAPVLNPFPGMQSHQQAPEPSSIAQQQEHLQPQQHSSSGGSGSHVQAYEAHMHYLNSQQGATQPPLQQQGRWNAPQNGAAGQSSPLGRPSGSSDSLLPQPDTGLSIFSTGVAPPPIGYTPYTMTAPTQSVVASSAFGAASSQVPQSILPADSQQSLSSAHDPPLLRPPSRSASTSVIGDRVVGPPPHQQSSSNLSAVSSSSSSLFSSFMGFGQRAASGQLAGEQVLPKPQPKGGFGPIGSRPRAASGQLPSQQIGQLASQQPGQAQSFQADAAVNGGSHGSAAAGSRVWQQVNGKAAGAQAVTGVPKAPRLENLSGDFNCFLNAVVQALWQCAAFRKGVLSLNSRAVQGSAVTGALAELFQMLARNEAQMDISSGGGSVAVVTPTRLREALSQANPRAFRVGEMSDAGEVLGELFEAVKAVRGGADLVEACFGQHVVERVLCASCQKATHVTDYTELIFNASATAVQRHLRATRASGRSQRLGQVLLATSRQAAKTCNADEGGCGRLRPVQARLAQPLPHFFALQLAWQRPCESADDIRDTLAAVQEELDLAELYLGLLPGAAVYDLQSAVCYYGHHYSAFVCHPHTGMWLAIADSEVRTIGSWADARGKCVAGAIQPSVLLFKARFLASS